MLDNGHSMTHLESHAIAVDQLIEDCETLEQLEEIGRRIAVEVERGEWNPDELAITRAFYSIKRNQLRLWA